MEESMNKVEYIMFDNAPKILKEESWDLIWSRCFMWTKFINCQFNFNIYYLVVQENLLVLINLWDRQSCQFLQKVLDLFGVCLSMLIFEMLHQSTLNFL